ncbi:uncharacterized protein LOC132790582 [Drosophila nasuta]|uniref:uncharacterized protein LOC132790582 n=1 Tax=Drosophila nasuta TaxID=42062 RepID=UPI00295EAD68|nr:uncharacterized protein LOC132790582 [Drosophila nasuta]
MSLALTPLQRHVADGIVKFICRGNYDKALGTLNYMAGTFPPQEESTLRRLLKRLQRNNKTMDSLPVYKVLLQELPDVDANLIRRMDTHIPHEMLGEIYDQMHSRDFEQFQVQLEHLQRVEYNVMRHTLILYEHCTKLKAAQRALDKHHLMSGICLELYVLYCLILPLGIYLLTFLF